MIPVYCTLSGHYLVAVHRGAFPAFLDTFVLECPTDTTVNIYECSYMYFTFLKKWGGFVFDLYDHDFDEQQVVRDYASSIHVGQFFLTSEALRRLVTDAFDRPPVLSLERKPSTTLLRVMDLETKQRVLPMHTPQVGYLTSKPQRQAMKGKRVWTDLMSVLQS